MTAARKLTGVLAILVTSVLMLTVSGWFALGIVATLPLAILLWFDVGRELRGSPSANQLGRAAGVLMGVPQALFGIVCVAIGVSIVLWVLCNSFVERNPHYSGGFLTFAIGPVLTAFGAYLASDAFKRGPPSNGA